MKLTPCLVFNRATAIFLCFVTRMRRKWTPCYSPAGWLIRATANRARTIFSPSPTHLDVKEDALMLQRDTQNVSVQMTSCTRTQVTSIRKLAHGMTDQRDQIAKCFTFQENVSLTGATKSSSHWKLTFKNSNHTSPTYTQVGHVVLGFVHIDPKEKVTSLPDGFIEKPI